MKSVGHEASAFLRSYVYEYLGACDFKRGWIEVKASKDSCMSQKFCLASRGQEVAKYDVTLWENVVPFIEGKAQITG